MTHNQSQGDIIISLSSQIAAVGRSIAWMTETVMPKSQFKTQGVAVIEQDGCSIRIQMGQSIQPITTEEFKIRIDLPENVGLLTDVVDKLICAVVVNYDIRPTAIEFQFDKQTIHRRDAKSVNIPICKGQGSPDIWTTGTGYITGRPC